MKLRVACRSNTIFKETRRTAYINLLVAYDSTFIKQIDPSLTHLIKKSCVSRYKFMYLSIGKYRVLYTPAILD